MLKEIIIAIQSYGEAHRFIVKHKLWQWILIPGLIYAVMFFSGIVIFWKSSDFFIEKVLGIAGLNDVQGFLKFLLIFGSVILKLIIMLLYFSLFKYLFLIIGSPLFAYLSEKTEAIIEGNVM